jgi:hypothetical protein
MPNHWPTGDRDTTEFPSVDVSVRPHLEAFLGVSGIDYNDGAMVSTRFPTIKEGPRFRTYRKLYERLGLTYKDQHGKFKLSPFGDLLHDLTDWPSRLDGLIETAAKLLVRYQFANPLENHDLPVGSDIHPYYAILKAMSELDGKLHHEEINRVLMKTLRNESVPDSIETIRSGRELLTSGVENASSSELAEIWGDRVIDDQPEARIAPWFSLAGWGGLLIQRSVDPNDHCRHLTPEAVAAVQRSVSNPPPVFQGGSATEWYAYYHKLGENPTEAEEEVIIPTSDLPAEFNRRIEECGVKISQNIPARFLASLAAKRFLILCGNSGTGKTQLGILASRILCPSRTTDILAVGADWSDSRALLGQINYFDTIGEGEGKRPKFLPTITTDLISRVWKTDDPGMLVLDEMNLSHVERYFADFLSSMESKEPLRLYAANTAAIDAENYQDLHEAVKEDGDKADGLLPFPGNLSCIGTVNIDETTYMFSPKVLDRANVIELHAEPEQVDEYLKSGIGADLKEAEYSEACSKALSKLMELVDIAEGLPHPVGADPTVEKSFESFREALKACFTIMRSEGWDFGFRTLKEAMRYAHACFLLGRYDSEDAWVQWFDEQMVQKVLPKLHGGERRLGRILTKMTAFAGRQISDLPKPLSDLAPEDEPAAAAICAWSYEECSSTGMALLEILRNDSGGKKTKSARFPLSFKKLGAMLQDLDTDQYAGFIR